LPARSGWWVVPLSREVVRAATGTDLLVPDLEDEVEAARVKDVLQPLVAAVGALALDEPVALCLTQYAGGAGEQVSLVVRRDSVAVGPCTINAALEEIGVRPAEGEDAFDAVGLGQWRSMDALRMERVGERLAPDGRRVGHGQLRAARR
jgi:hypothetical protein